MEGFGKVKGKKFIVAKDNGKEKLIRNTYTGKVTDVNANLLKTLLRTGYTPVLTQPAISEEHELINTDNDRTTAVLAKELRIKKIVILFEAKGFLQNFKDDSTLIKKIDKKNLPKLAKYAKGNMRKKVLGAIEAFENGVESIYWGDARIKNPITEALNGKGTVIS